MFIKLNVTQDDINKSRYIHQHIDTTHIDNLLLYFSMSCVSALIRCQIRSSESPPFPLPHDSLSSRATRNGGRNQ